ncbi:uroporphyrinogen decarboxylase [Rhodocista pekingensis]|uniref:Uroporphyrinogen decarboxylase n=1 Tax=Rhodocista pekingensis TaxID=201185 RepID=A0ABW2KSV5_9PROT
MTAAPTKPFLRALAGETQPRPPFWLMRQAGRYLPEYREVRAQAGGFLDLCLKPALGCEVTLQPLRRYGMDAAILFSDILLVPHALGQSVGFAEGEGPRLAAIRDLDGLRALDFDGLHRRAEPVYETVRRIRENLDKDFPSTALIGFAGSPWTVACYMVEGQGSKEYMHVKQWAFRDPEGFGQLIDLLVRSTVEYISAQIKAGAEAVQLFDSWAGALPVDGFHQWVIKPTRAIVDALRARHPGVPIIGFPRQAGLNLEAYVRETGVDGVSLDPGVPAAWASQTLKGVTLQGNLDPVLLLAGGAAMRRGVTELLEAMSGRPFIFNLGHGILKETPPEHVAELTRLLRG